MRRVLLLIVLALLALPASAVAATRYASPGGGAIVGCPQAEPCSLTYAITAAAANDEVVVTPGIYNVASGIEPKVPLSIHGVAGQPLPRIVGAPKVTLIRGGEPLAISDLAVEATEASGGAIFATANGDVFDHLELIGHGIATLALRPGDNFTLTDSLLISDWEGSAAIFVQGVETGTAQLRNDTIVSTGAKSFGIALFVTNPAATVTIDATNVIAQGTVFDAEAGATPGGAAAIVFDHSNFDTSKGNVTATNSQTAAPVFVNVNAAGGDYREAAGSPTINAGINDPANGATDLLGNPRALPAFLTCTPPTPPAVTDIGAFEYVPPAPPCTPPAPLTKPLQTKITKGKIRGRRASFRFSGSGGTSGTALEFSCKLDRSPWRACSSPKVYRHLKAGRHTFRVRAASSGAVDATAAKRRFKIRRLSRHHH